MIYIRDEITAKRLENLEGKHSEKKLPRTFCFKKRNGAQDLQIDHFQMIIRQTSSMNYYFLESNYKLVWLFWSNGRSRCRFIWQNQRFIMLLIRSLWHHFFEKHYNRKNIFQENHRHIDRYIAHK